MTGNRSSINRECASKCNLLPPLTGHVTCQSKKKIMACVYDIQSGEILYYLSSSGSVTFTSPSENGKLILMVRLFKLLF